MYQIIDVADHSGNPKTEWFDELSRAHPTLTGFPVQFMPCFCLAWEDNPLRMLRTSYVKALDVKGNFLIVTTKNSVYTLEYTGGGDLITEEDIKNAIVHELISL